ncbi:MAG TPA: hypothetical protein VLB80_02945 [Candidatus Babeliales bacterium]|nr:hypothetical protein [Candidatus Babeliales bacterium]
MKQKLSIFICIVGLLYVSLAQSEGFAADTLIYTQNGIVPIKCIVIGLVGLGCYCAHKKLQKNKQYDRYPL